jgi:hypothetical protein
MNGNGRAAEYPKIKSNYRGGFVYPYQFEEGAHASVPNAGVSRIKIGEMKLLSISQ